MNGSEQDCGVWVVSTVAVGPRLILGICTLIKDVRLVTAFVRLFRDEMQLATKQITIRIVGNSSPRPEKPARRLINT